MYGYLHTKYNTQYVKLEVFLKKICLSKLVYLNINEKSLEKNRCFM